MLKHNIVGLMDMHVPACLLTCNHVSMFNELGPQLARLAVANLHYIANGYHKVLHG